MDSFFFKGGVSLDIWRESRWLLCVIAAGAGFTDLRDGKVYNWWLLWGALAGCWIRGTAFFPGAFLFLVPALVLFRFRMMGAGDGKFMAVIGGWMGIGDGCRTVCLGLMIAVVYSLCRLRRGRGLRARLTYFLHISCTYSVQKRREPTKICPWMGSTIRSLWRHAWRPESGRPCLFSAYRDPDGE